MGQAKYKRRLGDKRDGRLIRHKELDTNHYIMPLVWPNRTDNEAFIYDDFDLTEVNKYLEKKNEGNPGKYTLFMFLLAVFGKTVLNRPKMNRFYRHTRLYEKYDVTIGFTVKKTLCDDADEALARVVVEPDDTFDTFAERLQKEIDARRSEEMDKSSDDVRILMKFPHFVGRLVMSYFRRRNRIRPIPEGMSSSDMFFTSVAVSNLGSIGLRAGYHHLSNWGTNSFFVTLGERKIRPFIDKQGKTTLKDSIDIGFIIDERIADGLYFSRTIRYMKRILEHPEIMDEVFKKEEVEE